jgi:phosphoglucosamine mutase
MTNLFGTDGIRGTVGVYPFTTHTLPSIGRAIGMWIQETYGSHTHIVLAQDTRQSCQWIKESLKEGLLTNPVIIHDASVLPTPAVFTVAQQDRRFSCGIVISGSHNPYTDNGIKIIDAQNGKITHQDEQRISELIQQAQNSSSRNPIIGVELPFTAAIDQYTNQLTRLFEANLLIDKKIVLDLAHGATYQIAPLVFKALGAQVIVLNDKPTGININYNCGTLYPEDAQKVVLEQKADLGIVFDGDGDRVLAINKYGELKDGDDIIALLSSHPLYTKLDTIIGTVMSNQALEIYFKNQNKHFIRTAVGDKHIAKALATYATTLGSEPSGHIILWDKCKTADGILAALMLTEALAYTNNWDMVTFKKYPQVLLNIPVKHKKDLHSSPIADIIHASTTKLQSGRLIVRYSGTEYLLRIMIEEKDQELAQLVSAELAYNLQEYF